MSCRLFDGTVKPGGHDPAHVHGGTYKVEEVGVFRLSREPRKELTSGMVGYLISGIKTVSDTRTGDTVTLDSNPVDKPLPGFTEVKPVVFSSIYPVASDDYQSLLEALENISSTTLLSPTRKILRLPSVRVSVRLSGTLAPRIVQERLEREFDQSIVMTMPSVRYRFLLSDGRVVTIDNPQYYPDPAVG